MVRMIRKLLNLLNREKSTALVVQRPANQYGTWSQVVQGPNRGGYIVRCCGTATEFDASEAQRSENRKCGCCGGALNLLRSIDAIAQDGNFKQDLAVRLSNLAIKPYAQPQQQGPRFVLVGEESGGEVSWGGAPPSSGVQWR